MAVDKDILKVKESFENAPQFSAPNQWESISAELDQANLDKKIKSTFEENITAVAPPFSQLNLDAGSSSLEGLVKSSFEGTRVGVPETLWENVQNGLDVDAVWERIKDKIVVRSNNWQAVAVAASLALLVAIVPFQIADEAVAETIPLGSNQTLLSTVVSEGGTNSAELYAEAEINQPVDVLSGVNVPTITSAINNGTVQNSDESKNGFEKGTELNSLAGAEVNTIKFVPAQPNIEIESRPEISKWSMNVGVIGGVNRTWILDNDTRASFEKETLLDSKMAVGEMYGITAEAVLNNRHTFGTNILLNSAVKSRLGYFDNGQYKVRETKINFFKMSFLYGQKFNFQGKRNDFSLHLKVGPYIGFNKNSIVKENDVITSFNSSYNRIDFGLNMQLGQEHEISRFIVGYGINAEYGLHNMFEGNGYIPPKLNYSNNFGAGVYFNVKYRIF